MLKLNFYEKNIVEKIKIGKKTIETRALNPEEKDRYFGSVKVGEKIILVDKNTNEEINIIVDKILRWSNLGELYNDKKNLEKVYGEDISKLTLEDVKECYSFTADYLERIEKNGLIGFEFSIT